MMGKVRITNEWDWEGFNVSWKKTDYCSKEIHLRNV